MNITPPAGPSTELGECKRVSAQPFDRVGEPDSRMIQVLLGKQHCAALLA